MAGQLLNRGGEPMLTEAERRQVAEAIAAVERETDAELVTVLARRADDYRPIALLWAAVIALLTPGVLTLTPIWLELWEVLALQWLLFLLLAVVLRWPPLLMRLVPRRVRQWRAAGLARRQFLEQNLHHTRFDSGVLIFVSAAEHYVEIIADRGICRHVSQAQWQAIVDAFTAAVRRGETLRGFLDCVNACGELLKRHVPVSDQKNELPDHLVLLD
jgi:putative membrane protein